MTHIYQVLDETDANMFRLCQRTGLSYFLILTLVVNRCTEIPILAPFRLACALFPADGGNIRNSQTFIFSSPAIFLKNTFYCAYYLNLGYQLSFAAVFALSHLCKVTSMAVPSPENDFERARQARIADNNRKMQVI